MKCIIPGDNARIFAKFIQFLSKVGPDLYLEALNDGLSLRTVNSSKSGFASIQLGSNFFSEYSFHGGVFSSPQDMFCRVSMKSCLGIFKSMKNVESCQVSLDLNREKLIFQLRCKQNTRKTHYISILEQENLNAVQSTGQKTNSLTASFKVFTDIISIFQVSEEELTIEATKKHVAIKNYLEAMNAHRQNMRTKLQLEPAEFDVFTVSEETNLTFCLKEWRAFLILAEALNMCITINFETTGHPVEFKMWDTGCFEVVLIMSTLFAETIDPNQSDTSIVQVETRGKKDKNVHRKRISVDAELKNMFKRTKTANESSSGSPSEVLEIEMMDTHSGTRLPSLMQSASIEVNPVVRGGEGEQARIETPASFSERRVTIREPLPAQSHEMEIVFCKDTESEEADRTQIRPGQDVLLRPSFMRKSADEIPDSPPSQSDESRVANLKLFRRCFEPTFRPSNVTGLRNVLADSSDED